MIVLLRTNADPRFKQAVPTSLVHSRSQSTIAYKTVQLIVWTWINLLFHERYQTDRCIPFKWKFPFLLVAVNCFGGEVLAFEKKNDKHTFIVHHQLVVWIPKPYWKMSQLSLFNPHSKCTLTPFHNIEYTAFTSRCGCYLIWYEVYFNFLRRKDLKHAWPSYYNSLRTNCLTEV